MKYQTYPAYKDSGVEWLGEIPEHWFSTKIKYGYEITLGKMLQKEAKLYEGELKPYLKAINIQLGGVSLDTIEEMWFSKAELKSLRLVSGDVLVSEGGDVGRAAIWKNELPECYIQNAVHRIRPRTNKSSRYFYYWIGMLKDSDFINTLCNKATIAHYTVDKVESSPLFIPLYDEAEKIAQFLDHETAKIDTLIEKQQRLIELLKEKRQAVISHAVTKGLNPNAPMKESGVEWLGDVPEGWEVSKIGHCAFVTKLTGFEYTNLWETSEDGEIIALRGFNVQERYLELHQTERISFDLSKKLVRSKLSKGDIVFPCTGTIGNAALIESDNKFHINQNVAKISFENVSPKFAIYWLTSSFVRKLIERNNMSGMQPVVLIGDIRKLPIPRMSFEEQNLITEYLDSELDKFNKIIDHAQQAVNLIQERRTALISAAVTGKIDVRDWGD
jgi:type I restriction enzyme S subunit